MSPYQIVVQVNTVIVVAAAAADAAAKLPRSLPLPLPQFEPTFKPDSHPSRIMAFCWISARVGVQFQAFVDVSRFVLFIT